MTDHFIANIVTNALNHEILPTASEVTADIDQVRTIARIANLIFFAVGAYFLLGLTLRPIKEMVESQRQFIANVSHELRTPLALMKTESEVAWRSKDEFSKEDAINLLKRNVTRVDHVARIIQFFLILSDFNSKDTQEMEQLVSLKKKLSIVEAQLKAMIEEKGISISHVRTASNVMVKGNPVALEKMALNILRNAVTYTPEGGKIVLVLRERSGGVELAVVNSGVGIAAEDLPRIFDPFYRGCNAIPGGSGIGLSIVKEVARIHGGKVRVESEEGKGATVSVYFPKEKLGIST